MHEDEETGTVECQLCPGLPPATEPLPPLETPEAAAPGVRKYVRIEGVNDKQFLCSTEAHPGRDHEFRVGARTVMVPWDTFRLYRKRLFLKHEVTWE